MEVKSKGETLKTEIPFIGMVTAEVMRSINSGEKEGINRKNME